MGDHALASDSGAALDPMGTVLSAYEQQVKAPVTSLFAGDLPRLLLIQIQAVKVESERALLQVNNLFKV